MIELNCLNFEGLELCVTKMITVIKTVVQGRTKINIKTAYKRDDHITFINIITYVSNFV